jgi:hypothetical protein
VQDRTADHFYASGPEPAQEKALDVEKVARQVSARVTPPGVTGARAKKKRAVALPGRAELKATKCRKLAFGSCYQCMGKDVTRGSTP